jgi:hypothetical protein
VRSGGRARTSNLMNQNHARCQLRHPRNGRTANLAHRGWPDTAIDQVTDLSCESSGGQPTVTTIGAMRFGVDDGSRPSRPVHRG